MVGNEFDKTSPKYDCNMMTPGTWERRPNGLLECGFFQVVDYANFLMRILSERPKCCLGETRDEISSQRW